MHTGEREAVEMAATGTGSTLPVVAGPPAVAATRIELSAAARARLAQVVGGVGGAVGLRLSVLADGCTGALYDLELVDAVPDDHREVDVDGVRVFVEPHEHARLDGVRIDHVDHASGGGFAIQRTVAADPCGCGFAA